MDLEGSLPALARIQEGHESNAAPQQHEHLTSRTGEQQVLRGTYNKVCETADGLLQDKVDLQQQLDAVLQVVQDLQAKRQEAVERADREAAARDAAEEGAAQLIREFDCRLKAKECELERLKKQRFVSTALKALQQLDPTTNAAAATQAINDAAASTHQPGTDQVVSTAPSAEQDNFLANAATGSPTAASATEGTAQAPVIDSCEAASGQVFGVGGTESLTSSLSGMAADFEALFASTFSAVDEAATEAVAALLEAPKAAETAAAAVASALAGLFLPATPAALTREAAAPQEAKLPRSNKKKKQDVGSRPGSVAAYAARMAAAVQKDGCGSKGNGNYNKEQQVHAWVDGCDGSGHQGATIKVAWPAGQKKAEKGAAGGAAAGAAQRRRSNDVPPADQKGQGSDSPSEVSPLKPAHAGPPGRLFGAALAGVLADRGGR